LKQYKELAGQTIIYGLGTIIPRVLNFLLTPLYTYVLVAKDFGIITEMYSYVAFFMVLLTFGMETTFFRFSSQSKEPKKVFNNSFFIILVTSSIFLTSIILFRNEIAAVIGYKGYTNYIIYLSFIIFFDALVSIPLAKLRLENKALKFTLIRVSNISINILSNIFFFVICRNSSNEFLNSLYNPTIGLGYAFISNLLASFFNFLILLPLILKFKLSIDKIVLKEMFIYTIPLVFVGFAAMINEVADKLFLKYLTVPSSDALSNVGIYGANYKLAILMTIFIQVFKYAAEPFFFKNSLETDAKRLYSNVMTWFVIFCLAIFLLVTLYISIFQYFIGESYRVGLFIVPIILIANMFLGIYYNLSIWYKIANLTYLGALISFIGVIITVSLNFLLIPIIGYFGSAMATLLCYFAMMVLSYLMGRKFYPVEYNIKKILLYILITFIIYGIRYAITFSSFSINIVFSTSLFASFILFITYFEKVRINKIRSLF